MSITISKLKIFVVSVCAAAAFSSVVGAQTPVPKPTRPDIRPRAERPAVPLPPIPPADRRNSSEKALAVDPKINIKIPCVLQARVTVNGWDRDEIRVFIRGGSDAAFKVLEKDPKSGKPVWVLITRQSFEGRGAPFSECLSGERIDIEVPFGATLTISGKETDTRIDSVKKINLENVDGSVALRNISGGISSKTYKGDVAVENSAGQIALETTSGNINAYGVSPGQVGDVFKARTTNGRITLQNVEHRQIGADSVSGEVLFSGKFLPGGLYSLKTTAGSIRLAIPVDSSCNVTALFGGTLNSVIPMKTLTENVSPAGKLLKALIGTGDSTVNLTTHTGQILITKL